MTKMSIRGVSLNVKVIGKGYPLVLMHGGPGADLYTMMSLKPWQINSPWSSMTTAAMAAPRGRMSPP